MTGHAWDIGWNNGRRQSLDGASTGKPAIGILSIDRFLLSLWGGYEYSVEKADLCIVGAGLAGINALFVASRYLTATNG